MKAIKTPLRDSGVFLLFLAEYFGALLRASVIFLVK